jgi:arabinogalactan endo-1,4-beta-galactosidase
MQQRKKVTLSIALSCIFLIHCKDGSNEQPAETLPFYFGADLSYVNQIIDHQGVYKDDGEIKSPYRIFKAHGANLVRLRLWHDPTWTKQVYGDNGTQLYNDLKDVEKGIRLAKDEGLRVLLDFHYSDSWADPGKQEIPASWKSIKTPSVLNDSVYQYTLKTLQHLNAKGLMPELVQIGNETNCGMLFTDAPQEFPACNVCHGQWQQMGEVVNSAIRAVRTVASSSTTKTKIILHVADPKNLDWWFGNMINNGKVTDFDIMGFSYYPLWHTTVTVNNLSVTVRDMRNKYQRPLIILETAYPWTTESNDDYNNIFGGQTPIIGFPFSKEGQYNMMKALTQAMIDAGGAGVVYWEPAWISSQMKDKWGTGSSWENNAFFDFNGNPIPGIDFMNHAYPSK